MEVTLGGSHITLVCDGSSTTTVSDQPRNLQLLWGGPLSTKSPDLGNSCPAPEIFMYLAGSSSLREHHHKESTPGSRDQGPRLGGRG
jgi:hypothetical protein